MIKVTPINDTTSTNPGRREIYPNQPGMTKSVEEYTEDPQQFLVRALTDGEVVLEQFDVYFPTAMIPKWKLILFITLTCGLYLIVLAYRAFLRWCYKIRCLTPKLYILKRGKMAITNKGRIIVWEQEVIQVKVKDPCCGCLFKCCCRDTCAPPAVYSIYSNSKSYKVDTIRQISQFYSSASACFLCWCCCIDYECGVEVSFNEFNHYGSVGSNSFLTTVPNTEMTGFIKKFVQWVDLSTTGGFEVFSNLFGLTNKSHVFYIVSNTQDMVRNGEIHKALEDINELYARIMKVIPGIADKFVDNDKISKGKIAETDKFTGVTIVDSDMTVTIPPKWFQLLPTEIVLNSVGLVYKMSCMDYVRVICSFGYHYCSVIHHKKFKRAAIVITNKRVIVVDLDQRAGMVPSHLSSFTITVRCYIPGPILNGYIYSSSFQHLETAISGLGGTIHIEFPTRPGAGTRNAYLPFAKAFQQSKTRGDSRMGNDIEGQLSANDWQTAKNAAAEGDRLLVSNYVGGKSPLDPTDLMIIPFIQGEEIIDLVRGLPKWEPFCNFWYWCANKEVYESSPPANCCEKGKCCFPVLPFICTCALRPFRNLNDIIITNHTIFQYIRQKNDGICGFCGPICDAKPFFWPCDGSSIICQTNASFFLAWSTSASLHGHTVQYEYDGNEIWYSRLCMHNSCGKICCPVNDASYDLILHVGNMDFMTSGKTKNTNWKNSEALQRAEKLLNDIEVIGR